MDDLTNPLYRSLASLFRSRAEVTSLSRLDREGFRTVNVLDIGDLESIVVEAVERVVAELGPNGASPGSLAAGAQIELLKLVGDTTRLNEKNAQLEREQKHLEGDLSLLQGALAESRKSLEANIVRADHEAMGELRQRLESSLAELFQRARTQVERVAPDAARSVDALRAPLRDAMLVLLSTALRRGHVPPTSDSEMQVEVLERRVKKLTAQLDETEQLLERVRREKSADEAGVASIYRTVQGLRGDEAAVAQRRALLHEIFRHNLELRSELATASPENRRA
jgi:vacuolar-type H+-ATPase subunit I/STV1